MSALNKHMSKISDREKIFQHFPDSPKLREKEDGAIVYKCEVLYTHEIEQGGNKVCVGQGAGITAI